MTRTTASRILSMLAVGGLPLALAPVASAQCGVEVEHEILDAGTATPRLTTPEGAAVLGSAYSVQVTDALPFTLGVIFFGGFQSNVVDPATGATLHVGTPLFVRLFATNAEGRSNKLLRAASLDNELCGVQVLYQAALVDEDAPGGFGVTNAIRIVIGGVTEPMFGPKEVPFTMSGKDALAVVDFDQDGIQDLITVSNRISAARGLVGGGFANGIPSGNILSSPTAPSIGDLDGDGGLDLVLCETTFSSDELTVARLSSSGGLASVGTFAMGTGLRDTAIGDIDLDGVLDIAVAVDSGPDALVLRGVGGAFFELPTSVSVGAAQGGIELVDLDTDGTLDLVATLPTLDQVAVAGGFGDGTFGPATATTLGGSPTTLLVDDLDGDGELDVATGDQLPTGVSVALGGGDGSLSAAWTESTQWAPRHLFALDHDQDGQADLLATHGAESAFSLLYGAGAGALDPALAWGTKSQTDSIAPVDGDHDGQLEIYAIDSTSNATIHRRRGDRGLQGHRVVGVPFAPNAPSPGPFVEMAVGDLDGDGRDDVVTNGGVDTVEGIIGFGVVLGSASGPFLANTLPAPGVDPHAIAIAELTGDGVADLFVGDRLAAAVHVLPGNGDGTFGAPIASSAPVLDRAELAFVDGDAFLDLVSGPLDGPVTFSPGNGDGTFAAAVAMPAFLMPPFALGDIDGDGAVDIVASTLAEEASLLLGNGDGTFGAPTVIASGLPFSHYDIRDVDGDGLTDVFVASSNTAGALLGDGTGAFPSSIGTNVGLFNIDYDLADFDQDGTIDLISTRQFISSEVNVFPGLGDGKFDNTAVVQATVNAARVASGDFDGDGIVDAVCSTQHKLAFLLNLIGE